MKLKSYKFKIMNAPIFLIILVIMFLSACSDMMKSFNKNQIPIFGFGGPRYNAVPKNAVGATTSFTLRTLDFTPTDSNAVFVSKTGNDTNIGTHALPKLTLTGINGAISACTVSKQAVVMMDSGTYDEKGFEFGGNFLKLVSALGQKPVVQCARNNGFISIASSVSETSFHDAHTIGCSVTQLANGNIFIAYTDGADGQGKYVVYDHNFGIIKSESIFHNTSTYDVSVTGLADSSVFIAYVNSVDTQGRFVVVSSDYSSLSSDTMFHDHVDLLNCTRLSSGLIIIVYTDANDSYKGKYLVLNPNYTIAKDKTLFYNYGTYDISVKQLAYGNILIAYIDRTYFTGKYIVLNTDYSTARPETLFHNDISGCTVTQLQNGMLFFGYMFDDSSTGNVLCRYSLMDADYTIVQNDITVNPHNSHHFYATTLSGGSVFAVYDEVSPIDKGFYVVLEPQIFHIKITNNAVMNGITFTAADRSYLYRFINNTTGSINAKWCDFRDNISTSSDVSCVALYSAGDIDVRNCKFYNNDMGVESNSNNAKIIDTQFYNNSKDYALRINGFAASPGDITVNHCDFFNNGGGGLIMKSNSGVNEVIKNSIFHGNGGYGASSANPVAISYSVVTDAVMNVTQGTGYDTGDALYVNESLTDPGAVDLNIETLLTGYPADSPARGLADDGRNAGAYDVEYVEK